MSSIIIETKGLTKSFGQVNVLKGIDLTVNEGDRYVLFGSNGAGKTTLVKILTALIPADSGEISLFGRSLAKNPKTIKSKIGFMSHDHYLYNELTAWENLDFFGQLYSIPRRNARIKELLKLIGLYHRAYDITGNFSRGMKQRLSLARALLHDPRLIILDEPYSGLDLKAQNLLNKLILKLSGEGKTFLFITHDLGKGVDIANRFGILADGRIAFESDMSGMDALVEKYNEILGGDRP